MTIEIRDPRMREVVAPDAPLETRARAPRDATPEGIGLA